MIRISSINLNTHFGFLIPLEVVASVTSDLVAALKSKTVLGAGLDVLEYEKSSFENLFSNTPPPALDYLLKADNVMLSPHVAGWTVESHQKLAQTIVDKIVNYFH